MVHAAGPNPGNQAIDTAGGVSGAAGANGLLNQDKDSKVAATDRKFGDIFQNIQNKYGAKAEKPREIKKTLGKDDFLKIMITQMRHQDPSNPFKAEQMATEMAQFTSVEQLQNMNQNLTKMANQNQPLERLAMTGLIGKTVTVDRTRFPHVEGQGDSLSFTLPKNANEVKLSVVTETGDVVMQKDLGAQKAGENSFSWDGMKNGMLPAKSGNYMFRIEAVDEKGQSLPTNPQKQARVIGVSFEGAEAVLLLGDSLHQEKVTLRNIVRVDDMGGAPGGQPAAMSGGGAPAGAAPANSNFFGFQKGVGSAPLDSEGLNAAAQEAIAKFQNQHSEGRAGSAPSAPAPRAPAAPAPASRASISAGAVIPPPQRGGAGAMPTAYDDGQKGFPNGLHDDEPGMGKPGPAGGQQVSQNRYNPAKLR